MALLAGWLGPAGRAEPDLKVVALSPVLAEIAAEVGGPGVRVAGLLPPGVDPHTFEPAPADLRALVGADLVIASGFGIEVYLDRLAANSGTRARIVSASDALAGLAPQAGGEPDPHWWNSIAATERVTRFVAAELSRLRPAGSAGFAARAAGRCAELRALDAWARAQIARVPADRRRLVTTHDAFGWFARDYGFSIRSITGPSPDAEPNARDFARLVDFIRGSGVPAVFLESSENAHLASTLVRETGVRLGGVLYPDGLVPEPDGSTYEAMFRHNVRTIVEALN